MKRPLVVLGLAVVFLCGCNIKTQTNLEQDLGFRIGTPYYTINGTGTEVMDVSSVQPGSVFTKAGFKTGDIFLDFRSNNSINKLCQLLEASRGKTVTLRVVPGGDGLPLVQRPVKKFTFKVPPSTR